MRHTTVRSSTHACIFLATLSACLSLSSSFQPALGPIAPSSGWKGKHNVLSFRGARPRAVGGGAGAGRLPGSRMAAALSPEGAGGGRSTVDSREMWGLLPAEITRSYRVVKELGRGTYAFIP
ncbi:hypothetical protein T484DRAFT_1867749 [Baffinella frigidus]|nr:hypothetical protein T484DRAFT_1867749 [Cryptophyta sp. CCMP2293]